MSKAFFKILLSVDFSVKENDKLINKKLYSQLQKEYEFNFQLEKGMKVDLTPVIVTMIDNIKLEPFMNRINCVVRLSNLNYIDQSLFYDVLNKLIADGWIELWKQEKP